MKKQTITNKRKKYVQQRIKELAREYGITEKQLLGKADSIENLYNRKRNYELFKKRANKLAREKREYYKTPLGQIEKNATEITTVYGTKYTKKQVTAFYQEQYKANEKIEEIIENGNEFSVNYFSKFDDGIYKRTMKMDKVKSTIINYKFNEYRRINTEKDYLHYLEERERKFLLDIYTSQGMQIYADDKLLKELEETIKNAPFEAIAHFITKEKREEIKKKYALWANIYDSSISPIVLNNELQNVITKIKGFTEDYYNKHPKKKQARKRKSKKNNNNNKRR